VRKKYTDVVDLNLSEDTGDTDDDEEGGGGGGGGDGLPRVGGVMKGGRKVVGGGSTPGGGGRGTSKTGGEGVGVGVDDVHIVPQIINNSDLYVVSTKHMYTLNRIMYVNVCK